MKGFLKKLFIFFYVSEFPFFFFCVSSELTRFVNILFIIVVFLKKKMFMNSNEWKVKWEVVAILLVLTFLYAICMKLL